MTVRSEELKPSQTASQPPEKPAAPPAEKLARRPRIGFLRPAHIERAFVALIYVALGLLVLLSVVGTFYGWRGLNAPLAAPWSIIADIHAAPMLFVIAAGIQGALSVSQYGARQFARQDRRWWIAYCIALAISVYYNILAYWTPLADMGLAWYVALALLLAGDIIPEIAAVRRS